LRVILRALMLAPTPWPALREMLNGAFLVQVLLTWPVLFTGERIRPTWPKSMLVAEIRHSATTVAVSVRLKVPYCVVDDVHTGEPELRQCPEHRSKIL